MTCVEKIENLLKEKKISRNKLSKDIGISNATFYNWQKRGSVPKGDILQKIAQYLDTTTDYLLGDEDNSRLETPPAKKSKDEATKKVGMQISSMTICERMFHLLDEKRLSASGLSKILGIGTNQTTNWKVRNTDPPAKYIIPICEYIGCSIEFLLSGEEASDNPVFDISENEQEMLDLFKMLPEREQILLIGRLQEMTAPLLNNHKKGLDDVASLGERVV